MKHVVQTGENCINIDGRDHTLKEASEFIYNVAVAINMVHFRSETVHAGEKLAHDAMKDHGEIEQ